MNSLSAAAAVAVQTNKLRAAISCVASCHRPRPLPTHEIMAIWHRCCDSLSVLFCQKLLYRFLCQFFHDNNHIDGSTGPGGMSCIVCSILYKAVSASYEKIEHMVSDWIRFVRQSDRTKCIDGTSCVACEINTF